jgi:hypothetical protein
MAPVTFRAMMAILAAPGGSIERPEPMSDHASGGVTSQALGVEA